MPCVARLLALCVGLAGWPGVGATAQDAPGSDASSSVRLIDVFPPLIDERRYRVEALRFKARDETAFDWAGSDEVMVDVCDGNGCTASDEVGGIDSGDVHEFLAVRSCVFGVVPGEVVLGRSSFCDIDDPGRPAPVRLRVEFREKDDIGIDVGFCAVVVGQSHHWPSHCADDGRGDDLIGWTGIEFPIKEIEAALRLKPEPTRRRIDWNEMGEPGGVARD